MEASPSSLEETLGLVDVMDAALIPCLPDKELQAAPEAAERHCHPPAHIDVQSHVREFMEVAKKLQLFFDRVGQQYQGRPGRVNDLIKEIAALEEELRVKDNLMQRQLQLLSKVKQLLLLQRAASIDALEGV
ncbi:unnamed protein product [Calypogeia fissa]